MVKWRRIGSVLLNHFKDRARSDCIYVKADLDLHSAKQMHGGDLQSYFSLYSCI